jgi:hypothetical protein
MREDGGERRHNCFQVADLELMQRKPLAEQAPGSEMLQAELVELAREERAGALRPGQ